jgi:hypothetical protein
MASADIACGLACSNPLSRMLPSVIGAGRVLGGVWCVTVHSDNGEHGSLAYVICHRCCWKLI